MRSPFLPEDTEDGPFLLDVADLDGVQGPVEAGAERVRLLEFLWETESGGIQPVLFLVRELLD